MIQGLIVTCTVGQMTSGSTGEFREKEAHELSREWRKRPADTKGYVRRRNNRLAGETSRRRARWEEESESLEDIVEKNKCTGGQVSASTSRQAIE